MSESLKDPEPDDLDDSKEESMLSGYKQVWYRHDLNGRYTSIPDKEWIGEKIANSLVHEDINQKLEIIRQDVLSEKVSALSYHMVKNHMDICILSEYSGFWKWQIKRHFCFKKFNKLNEKILKIYAKVFNMSSENLFKVPEN